MKTKDRAKSFYFSEKYQKKPLLFCGGMTGSLMTIPEGTVFAPGRYDNFVIQMVVRNRSAPSLPKGRR